MEGPILYLDVGNVAGVIQLSVGEREREVCGQMNYNYVSVA